MPAVFVKQNTVAGNSTASTTLPVTITAPAAGNLLVACIALGSSTANAQISGLASTGATWTRAAQSAFNATGTNRQEIWIGSGDTGTSVTITASASSKMAAHISEWSGLDATVDVTAVSSTGSVTNATNTTTSTGLSTPGGDLIIGAMNLATSNSSANFNSTSGSPDARTALTWSGSGATTSSNVGMQSVYDISSGTFINETFSWVTTAAWQYAWAAVSIRATTRTAAFTTSMTGTPVIAKKPVKAIASTLTATVALARVVIKAFTSTVTATVAVAKTPLKVLTTALTATVAVAKTPLKVLTTALTATVAIAKTPLKVLTATLTVVPVLARQSNKALDATMTAMVAFGKMPLKFFAATLAAGPGLTRMPLKTLSATVTATATVQRSISYVLDEAVLTVVGVLSKSPFKALTASVTATIDMPRTVTKVLSATVTASISLQRNASCMLAEGVVTATGVLAKSPLKTLTEATVSASATIQRTINRTLSDAVMTVVGVLAKSPGKVFSAVVTASVGIEKIPQRGFGADLAPAAVLTRCANKAVQAAVDVSAALSSALVSGGVHLYHMALTASLDLSALVSKEVSRSLYASVVPDATLGRVVFKRLDATLGASVQVVRHITRDLTAALSVTARVPKGIRRALSATIVPTTAFRKTPLKNLKATIGTSVRMARYITRDLTVLLSITAHVSKGIRRTLASTIVPATAMLHKTPRKSLQASLEVSMQMVRFIHHTLLTTLPLAARVSKGISRALTPAVVAPVVGVQKMASRSFSTTVIVSAVVRRTADKVFDAPLVAATSLRRLTMRGFQALLPLRGPRYVALFRPVVRYTQVLPQRMGFVMAGLRSHIAKVSSRARILTVVSRMHIAMAPSRARILTVVREHNFKKVEDTMKLVPSGDPGKEAEISPTEANIEFIADFKDEMPTGTNIVDYQVEAFRLGTGENITDSFVALVSQETTKVTAIVGDGTQTLKAVYRLRYTVALDNSPSSVIVGNIDIECKD